MTPQSTKVRLVRCPNCRQVLPELPDISLYRCGGCNTILQAKNRKMETNPGELTSETTHSVAETPQNYDSQVETRSSNPINDPPPEGSSRDKENITCRVEHVGSSSELSGLRSISNELSFSPETNRRENEDLPMEESLNHDKDTCSFGQFSEKSGSEMHDSDGDSIGFSNFSGEFPSSGEFINNKTVELTPEASECVEEVVIGSLYPPIKPEQQNGEGSFSQQEDRDFTVYEGQENYDSVAETPQNYDSQVETRSSNPINDPPSEGSSRDKENITCRVELVGSSSELSGLRSISNELSFSSETNRRENEDLPMEESLNHDKDTCSFGQFSEKSGSEMHDSDGDSIGCSNFSGEFPSSGELINNKTVELTPEASECVEEVVIGSLYQPIKPEQQNGEGSFSQLEDRDFTVYEGQENGSPVVVRKHVPLDIDCIAEEVASSSDHDLTSLSKEDLLLGVDNGGYKDENEKSTKELSGDSGVSDGLSSSPVVDISENEYPTVEESSNHDNFNLSFDQNFTMCDEVHDSVEEFTGVQTFTDELPSSNDLVYHETKEFTTKDSECAEDVENALVQPAEAVKFDGGNILPKARSLSEQEDSLPPVDPQHAELMKSNYICRDGVSEVRATTLNYDTNEELSLEKDGKIHGTENYHPEAIAGTSNYELICSPKEELPQEEDVKIHQDENYHPDVSASISNYGLISPQKEGLSSDEDGKIHEDEKLECSKDVFEIKTAPSNGLSDSHDVNFFENGYSVVEESLNDGGSNCSTGQQNNSDVETSEIRSLSSGETVYQKTEELNTEAREHVQEDVKVSLDQPTKVDKTDHVKSLGVLTAYENVFHDVGNISKHENQKNELPPKVTHHRLDHAYVNVESDDVAEKESEVSYNDLSTPPKGESLLDKDINLENVTKLSMDGSVSGDGFSLDEIKCGGNEDSLVETLYPNEGQHSKKYDTDLQVLEEASTKNRFSAELPPLVYHKIDELRPNTSTAVECFDQRTKIEESEGEKSLEFFQEGDKLLPEVSDYSDHEELKNTLSTVDSQQRRGSENDFVNRENDKFLHEVSNCSDYEDLKNRFPPVDGEHRGESENDSVNLDIFKKSEDQCANQNESSCEGMTLAGVASSFETVPHQNSNASQYSEPSVVNQALAVTPTTTVNSGKYVNPSDCDTNDASQSALPGRAVSANLTSADEDYKDWSRRTVTQNFGSASSAEFWGNSVFVDPNDSLISRGRYAYDGSESSDDWIDNQISTNTLLPSRRKAKYSDNISTMSTLKRNEVKDQNMVNFESGVSLKPPRPHAIRVSHRKPNEFTDTRRYVHSNEQMMTLSEGAASHLPFSSRDLPTKHNHQSPSIYGHVLSPSHSYYDSPDKVKLLRTVCELEDQLNRIQLPKISKSGGFHFQSGGKGEISAPLYFDHLSSERERYGGSNHLERYSRYNQEQGWADQSNVSRLALSEEAASYRHHQVNCPCSQCRAHKWHYSAPLPPQSSRYKSSFTVPQTGYNHLNVSSSSCPKHYKNSKFSGRLSDTELDHEMYRNNEMKRLYLMDKYHTSKKLLRPMAGGSPFVSCYHCSELLQLPADFLLFKKRYHMLRCIACSKVLKFLLVEGMHIVPYLSDRKLPLSETGNFSDASNQRNLLPMPQFSSWPNGEPVSCSDDYGRSLHRSYSTEGEVPVLIPSSGMVERNKYDRNSSEATKERKMKSILKESVQNNRVSIRTAEPGTSSGLPMFINVPSEIEELPPLANSPLHQLMGYESPSEVINK